MKIKNRKTKKSKKVFALLLALTIAMSNVTPALASGLMDIKDIAGGKGGTSGDAGTIYFGSFWQTAKAGKTGSTNRDDYNKDAIKWRVLSVNAPLNTSGTNNNGVLLLSDQALYADEFNSGSVTTNKNVWGKDATETESAISSEVCTTLNNRTDTEGDGFAKDAFSAKEYEAIASTQHTAGGEQEGSDIVSTDKLFLLSYDEVQKTEYGFENGTSTTSKRKATVTEFAKNVQMYGNSAVAYESSGNCFWWLRSPGSNDFEAFLVYNDGRVLETSVYDDGLAVRPALNLNPESVLFLSAAVGGKGSAACGGGFALADYAGANGWKLTLLDAYDPTTEEGIKTPTLGGGALTLDANGSSTWKYSGASTGDNMYVSAVLKDDADSTQGNYINYAKLANTSTSTSASGTMTIGSSGTSTLTGNYYMFIFGEEENGEKATDYVSEFNAAIPVTFTNGKLTGMTLGSAFTDASNAVTLINGFELTLANATYNQNFTSDTGSNTLIADANDTTIAGDVIIKNGDPLTMKNAFTLAGTLFANSSTNTSSVNCDNLTLAENGFINMNDKDCDEKTVPTRSFRTLNVNNVADGMFKANNGTFVINTDLATNAGDKISFGDNVTVGGSAKVKVAYDPVYLTGGTVKGKYEFLSVTNGAIELTAEKTSYDKGNGNIITYTPTIDSDATQQKWIITSISDGAKPPVEEVSETTKSVSDTANAINMAWLETTNNLQKRLGDLRGGEASNTGWARFQRSLDDLNNGRKLNVSGNLYQIGYDFALKNDTQSRGYFGLSLEHFDGNQSFNIGGGDIKSTTLGAYYTKIYDSGHYFDFIFRYGRYESDTTSFDASVDNPVSTKLDYALNGVTLSGEYGYRANLGKSGLYIEPQAEFIYGYLGSASKRSSTGILADIDSTNHFVSRLGLALGQKVKNFNYYLRTSYYHDFAGSTNIKYGDASYKQDSAQNWWEVSLGGGWNVSDTSYFYAELTKHFKDISNSLNFNVGFRFTL